MGSAVVRTPEREPFGESRRQARALSSGFSETPCLRLRRWRRRGCELESRGVCVCVCAHSGAGVGQDAARSRLPPIYDRSARTESSATSEFVYQFLPNPCCRDKVYFVMLRPKIAWRTS